ncbi:MAG: hypothetical protein Q4F84_08480 [Fibrobacter sp.]|nr:hypothetical protein [Fibrobacter sp.]
MKYNFNIKTRTYMVLVLIFCMINGAAAYESEVLPDNLYEIWQDYCERIRSYSGSIHIVNSWDTGKEDQIVETKILGLPGFAVQEEKLEGSNTVFGVNNKYYFYLRGNKEKWILENVALRPKTKSGYFDLFDPQNTEEFDSYPDVLLMKGIGSGLDLRGIWLPVLLKRPGCKIMKYERLKYKSVNAVRLHFEYNDMNTETGITSVSGEIDLLPDHFWLIKQAKLDQTQKSVKDRWTLYLDMEYDFSGEIPLMVSRNVQCCDYHLPVKKRFSSVKKVSISKTETAITPNRFTLSHYGLPEPDFEIRRGRFSALRYGLMAIGFALILYAGYRICTGKRKNAIGSDGE